MNPFARLMKDDVYLENSSGVRAGPYKTAFQNTQIQIFETSLDTTEGDKVVRPLPNGKEDYFTVTEIEFSSGLSRIPAHYTLHISKDSAASKTAQNTTTTNNININNSQGIQVGNYNTQTLELAFNQLLEQINNSDASREQKEEAKGRLLSFISHPLVTAIVGASLPVALGLLS